MSSAIPGCDKKQGFDGEAVASLVRAPDARGPRCPAPNLGARYGWRVNFRWIDPPNDSLALEALPLVSATSAFAFALRSITSSDEAHALVLLRSLGTCLRCVLPTRYGTFFLGNRFLQYLIHLGLVIPSSYPPY